MNTLTDLPAAAKARFKIDHIKALADVIQEQMAAPGAKKWRQHVGRRTPQQLALLVLYCCVQGRVYDEESAPSRQAVALGLAQALGVKGSDWEKLRVGIGLLDLATRAELIEDIRRTSSDSSHEPWRVRLTAAAMDKLGEYVRLADQAPDDPLLQPQTGPVWVRQNQEGLIKPEAVPHAYSEACDAIRNTGWRINEVVLDAMMRDEVEVELRERLSGSRKSFVRAKDTLRALAAANRFRGKTIYFPVHLDFRGRVYQGGALRFTGASAPIQALLEFANGEKVNTHPRWQGAMHLAAYVAGTWGRRGDVEKLAEWTAQNETLVLATLEKPGKRWRDLGDDRWKALAACNAWRRYRDGESVHLPCSFDATTSGLQMYALLVRDDELGKKVGLIGERGGFYEAVMKSANTTRDAAKAVGIPYFYGAGEKKTCEALEDLGVKGDLASLNRRIRKVIETEAPSFKRTKKWLERIGREFSELKKPFYWRTPLGFLVNADYRHMGGINVTTYIWRDGRSRRIKLVMQEPTKALSAKAQSKAVAANLIHSLDAALLMATVREGATKRHRLPLIDRWGVVHDCFAVHPNHAAHLRENVAKHAIWAVFGADYLQQLYEQFEEQAGKDLPAPPAHNPTLSMNEWGTGWEALTI